jgi:2-dehydropantoate 2-reductase
MKIAVLGTGAIGAYYGGQLALAGQEVTCFARGATLAQLQGPGLEIRTPEGVFRPSVRATDRLEDLGRVDFALLAVKSYSLEGVAPAVRHVAQLGAVIVPFLNGVETTDRLVGFGVPRAALLGGLTIISAARVAPGIVERRSPFQTVVVGELDGATSERAERVAAAFREAGADARASDHIVVELWQKFVFIAAMAAGCGLTRSPVGPVRADPLGRRLLERAVAEVVALARARGVALRDTEQARVMGMIDGLPPAVKPSFLVDFESGGPTELDILSGAVSRYGREAGVETPVHDTAAVALALSLGKGLR